MLNRVLAALRTLPLLAGAMIMALTACAQESAPATDEPTEMPESASESDVPVDLPDEVSELQRIDISKGTGATAVAGQNIVVHYTGWLYDPTQPGNKGAKFDSSLDRNQPFVFSLGAGQVIRGWDEGFTGMQTGGKRLLLIPPDMGYGARGAGAAIPPNATLMFEVELLDIR